VADDIHFQVKEFGDLTSKRQYGMVVTNPPYGLRLGVEEEAADIVRQMPDILRKLPTWSHFILSAAPNFEELVGQQATRRRKLYNGRIQCTYFQFYGPRPPRRAEGVSAERLAAEDLGPEESEEQPPEPETSLGPAVEGEAPPQTAEDAVPSSEYEVPSTEYGVPSTEYSVPSTEHPSDGTSPQPRPAPRPRPEPKPAFGGLPTRAKDQALLFHNRLTKLARHLRRWPTKQGITCYRLYDRDIPEVPLVVDRYENYLHIAEFERPNEHTLAEHSEWIDLMLDTAAETLEVPRDHVFCKRRERQRDLGQYERQAAEQHTTIANEGGLKFLINLSDYVDTGLFLDHRITRGMVREQAAGKRFLNLFCYTGAFTVHAAAGGAVSTTSVDLSNTYLDWARKNLNINNLLGEQHRLTRRDTLGFLREHPPGEHYDLAVADVPTYSRSKATEEDWDVQRDYPELLGRLLDLMPTGGVVYFSSNFRRLKFDETAVPQATIREISRQTVPADFRNKRIHRAWRLVKR
ncbi:MAG: class I SAM-dependent methyltransferase, partial [Planctomycetes bacterium]|nr:class I SAM-dependent methyltransferase [Planctomycetota bacterium]